MLNELLATKKQKRDLAMVNVRLSRELKAKMDAVLKSRKLKWVDLIRTTCELFLSECQKAESSRKPRRSK